MTTAKEKEHASTEGLNDINCILQHRHRMGDRACIAFPCAHCHVERASYFRPAPNHAGGVSRAWYCSACHEWLWRIVQDAEEGGTYL